jgi:hypothetical protein
MKALLAFGIALGILVAVPAMAQVWNEVDDAGDLPGTVQTPTGTGDLTAIAGAIAASDADMYCLRIDVPANFSATTCGGATLDTQLWLFYEDGRGVTFNDDDPGNCGQQTTVQSSISSAFITAPGQYLLAISVYNRDAQDAGGQLIWNSSPFGTERQPDGPGAANPIASWVGTTGSVGPYTIALTGATFCGPSAVEPATWGGIKSLYR